MRKKPKVAISIGDSNGIGGEILLSAHQKISQYCMPIYCAKRELLDSMAEILHALPLPKNTSFSAPTAPLPEINPGSIASDSGLYSFESFGLACSLADHKEVDFLTTLPIHKYAWKKAGIPFIGHTEYLRERYKSEGIMMLGCEKMFVALFSDHIPLRDVSNHLTTQKLSTFLLDFFACTHFSPIAVLGLNPHCGDNGLIGKEDSMIAQSILSANKILNREIFFGPFSADSAFAPLMRERFSTFVALYHDVGLAPLKALHFYESINVTLNIPILRTSVDHGVGFDIAYQNKADTRSYINAILLGNQLKHNKAE
ncbi:4-hydroxythreonine-4-phosphate dehydrogenase [Helicobacter mustelae]|uniref:4-hydroxythreonine-4-phosphate dehydrogenase n=1 Tax=Helicobacter mustelae (strain ATCC 43772 / CCUG 25715 / CIP 103759 / LMG 18044 / NCTC 12198 / R85-136P) TaxID=679897 RepID=D3UFK7_HELM1|nr:4-hydroxythreonine-4-phosphate dehydrogenase [Helicobacter mustelae]CBG39278.1 putative pyridoxal phosphate biosynthetic protein [Helicobacter mustelae 12198]SQH70788.1 pyridoxal phosphate biosynthetic protein [Helicobacter mustelae]